MPDRYGRGFACGWQALGVLTTFIAISSLSPIASATRGWPFIGTMRTSCVGTLKGARVEEAAAKPNIFHRRSA